MIALSRYLVFTVKGVTSNRYPCPDWYSYLQACKHLGIDPTRTDIPVWWIDKALIAMNAEASAQKSLEGR